MKRTRQAISSLHATLPISAVLLSHIHSDHISYYPLRVLEEYGIPVCLHTDHIAPLKEKHFNGYGFKTLQMLPYGSTPFEVGDFRIHPFEVVHNPWYATFGFDIRCHDKKIVIATDFCEWQNLTSHFVNADFIFVESNHDLALLKKYYNPNSRYHLPNPKTADLLAAAMTESKKPPQTVVLGHLSSQRNTARLALQETKQAFLQAGLSMDFSLFAAPLKEPGTPILI